MFTHLLNKAPQLSSIEGIAPPRRNVTASSDGGGRTEAPAKTKVSGRSRRDGIVTASSAARGAGSAHFALRRRA